jgi:hypothetical protein
MTTKPEDPCCRGVTYIGSWVLLPGCGAGVAETTGDPRSRPARRLLTPIQPNAENGGPLWMSEFHLGCEERDRDQGHKRHEGHQGQGVADRAGTWAGTAAGAGEGARGPIESPLDPSSAYAHFPPGLCCHAGAADDSPRPGSTEHASRSSREFVGPCVSIVSPQDLARVPFSAPLCLGGAQCWILGRETRTSPRDHMSGVTLPRPS